MIWSKRARVIICGREALGEPAGDSYGTPSLSLIIGPFGQSTGKSLHGIKSQVQ